VKAMRWKGSRWIAFVVALLVGNLVAGGVLVAASRDGHRRVIPDYYRRAAAWDQTMNAERSSLDVGWKASVVLRPDGVTIALRDRDGLPVSGAAVRIVGHHRGHADHALTQILLEAEPGKYRSAVALPFPGLWELDVQAHRAAVSWVTHVVADSGAP
jgi:nitrogen fixation protein FixH